MNILKLFPAYHYTTLRCPRKIAIHETPSFIYLEQPSTTRINMAAAQHENHDRPVRPRSYQVRRYMDGFLGNIGDLQKADVLQDVILQVEGRQFPCHRLVLSAASPYFRAMFTSSMAECRQKTVVLQGLDAAAFEKILKFIYSGTLHMSLDKVQPLYQAADLLQLDYVRNACSSYMAMNVERSNCLDMYKFADVFSIDAVLKQCLPCIYKYFAKVASTEEFYGLSVNQLTEIISHDELDVREETTVWEAVVRWVQHSREDRLHHLPSILPHIRFNLLTSDDTAAILEHPLVMNISGGPELKDMILRLRTSSVKKRIGMDAEEMVLLFRSKEDDLDTRAMLCVNPRSGEYMKYTEVASVLHTVLAATVTSDNDVYMLVEESDDRLSLLQFNQQAKHVWKEKLSLHRSHPERRFGSPVERLFEVDGHLYYLAVQPTSGMVPRHKMTRPSVVLKKYQWLTDQWKDCSNPRHDELYITKAASCGGKIFLFSNTEMHRYDPRQDRWNRGTPPKSIPWPGTAVAMGTEIFCADATLSNMAVYDVEADSWRELPGWADPDRNPNLLGTFFALEGQLHVLADFNALEDDDDDDFDDLDHNDKDSNQRIYVYDRLTGTWKDSQVTLPHGPWNMGGSGLPVARIHTCLPRHDSNRWDDLRMCGYSSNVRHGFVARKPKE
ncbi:kelch-like protein 12 [Branchiostoma lanceolatum]|uniref:kelch-like protein 12 n=1 Tax=Branchiostoma lanceolatum TaxID=7740 RepID=UPI0034562FE4